MTAMPLYLLGLALIDVGERVASQAGAQRRGIIRGPELQLQTARSRFASLRVAIRPPRRLVP